MWGKLFHNQDGSISIFWAVVLPFVIGAIGLGVDAGLWYTKARATQTIVDGATISAGRSVSGTASESAMLDLVTAELARNGITTADGSTISVNFPPDNGSYAGNSSAVEVIITRPQNRMFSVIALGSDLTGTTRSVAYRQTSGSACLLALEDIQSEALDFTGSVTINLSGCALASNSTHTASIDIGGNATINASQLYSAGGIRKTGSYSVTTDEPDSTFSPALSDPYSGTTTPSFSGCDENNKALTGSFGTVTLSEGVYCNGLDLSGNGTVNLNPGTYIIDRGTFNVNGGVTLNGTGVAIILTSSTGSNYADSHINGSAIVNLSAPSSNDTSGSVTGNFSGIAFYRDRNADEETISWNGGASMNITGALYFPNDIFQHNGNASVASTCTQIIAKQIVLKGDANYTSSCAGTGITPVSFSDTVRLVE